MNLNLEAAPIPGESNWKFLIQYMPYSLAVRELMRLRALYEMRLLEKPILDVGCGDGLFWQHLIQAIRSREVSDLKGLLGIDISASELKMASVRLKAEGGVAANRDIAAPVEIGDRGTFRTVIANCSLEHVSRIEPALRNIHSMLAQGGRFVLFVPSPVWTDCLVSKRICNRVSSRLGGLVGGSFDGFFQHRHLYPAEVWRFLLEGIGFEVEKVVGLGSPAANRLFEYKLGWASLAFVWKAIFRRYPWFLKFRRGWRTRKIFDFVSDIESGRILKSDLDDPSVVEFFIVCKKK